MRAESLESLFTIQLFCESLVPQRLIDMAMEMVAETKQASPTAPPETKQASAAAVT